MTKRPTDGIRRLCGLVNGMRDNEFAEATVRKAAIAEECDRIDAEVDAMPGCLMPEGCSWPVFEDGEPVRIRDEFECWCGKSHPVYSVTVRDGRTTINAGNDHSFVLGEDSTGCHGERVKRPAPKALDADGEEIRVGDVLYRKSDGHMVKVAEVYEKTFIDADDYVRPGDGFTHRAPVIAADGRPLREGEHVYHVETGAELVVKELTKPWEYQAVVVFAPPASHLTSFDPDQLTHQRPVLDAEGNRIEPAMDVWWVCEGDERGVHAERLHVESIGEDGLVTCDPFNGGTWVELEPSELYVNRPVLDADGVPIREGDTMWDEHCDELVVLAVYGQDVRCRYAEYEDQICDNGTWEPSQLTHRAPVLAADGRPLREGQTVWESETGDGYTVERIYSGATEPDFPGHTVACRRPDDIVTHMFKPSQLTHERPVLDADGVPIKKGDTVYWLEHTAPFTVVSPHETRDNAGQELKCGHTVEVMRDGHEPHMYVHPESLHHTKPERPDSRQAVVNEIGDEMAARIDLLVSSGRWSDAD